MATIYRVANLSAFAIEVDITNTAGHTTEIFVQPKARPRLPEGYFVTPQCLQEYQGTLVVLVDAFGNAGTELPQARTNALKATAKEGV
jgi:hypothetical protein